MKKRNGLWPWIVLGIAVLLIILLVAFGGFFGTGNPTRSAVAESFSTTNTQVSTQDVLCGQTYLHTLPTRIFIGNQINTAKASLTKSDFPSLLKDGSFYTANYSVRTTQTLGIGTATIQNNTDSPTPGHRLGVHILLGLNQNDKYLYKPILIFSGAVDFTNPSVIGQELDMMENVFGVAPGTNSNVLVLLRSPQKFSLSINGLYPSSKTISVENKAYTVELISATDYSSTIKVTNSTGFFDTKEITEGTSRKVAGLEVSVEFADEDLINNRLNTRLVVGAERFDFMDGIVITKGSYMDPVDGTYVRIPGGVSAALELEITFFRPDSLNDEIHVGETHTNPLFNNLKTIFDSYNNTGGAIIRMGGCVAYKSCIDSDGGNVPLTSGTMIYWTSNFTDSCASTSSLSEYYCSPEDTPLVGKYNCAYGCYNGACKPAPTSSCTYNKKLGGYVCK